MLCCYTAKCACWARNGRNGNEQQSPHKGQKSVFPCETTSVLYLKEPVDTRVEQQVVELRKQGVRKVSELKRHLAQFVTAELFKGASPPPVSRRRYYPSEKDLRNIMAKVKDQARHRIDQVNLEVSGAFIIPVWVKHQHVTSLYKKGKKIVFVAGLV